jgi:F-type H+-transporting ATPase subunit delta
MKVSAKQYANTLFELTKDKSELEIDKIIVQFVAQMKKMGDLKKSRDIIGQFDTVYNEKHNIIEAVVTSARQLSMNEQEKVKAFITKYYNATEVSMKYIIDNKIKGGIIIKVGDEILDGSVLGRIKVLNNNLKV